MNYLEMENKINVHLDSNTRVHSPIFVKVLHDIVVGLFKNKTYTVIEDVKEMIHLNITFDTYSERTIDDLVESIAEDISSGDFNYCFNNYDHYNLIVLLPEQDSESNKYMVMFSKGDMLSPINSDDIDEATDDVFYVYTRTHNNSNDYNAINLLSDISTIILEDLEDCGLLGKTITKTTNKSNSVGDIENQQIKDMLAAKIANESKADIIGDVMVANKIAEDVLTPITTEVNERYTYVPKYRS